MKISTAASTLLFLAFLAGMLSTLATLPFLPGYLPEGASPPMDEAEVRAAARDLMLAGGALWHASMAMGAGRDGAPPGAVLHIFSCGAVTYAAYRAWDVVAIVVAWLPYVQGPQATFYRFAVASPFAFLLFVVVVDKLASLIM